MNSISRDSSLAAGLYLRISREDEKGISDTNSSVSIETQRIKLMHFAQKNNIEVYDIYVDDGFTGTNYNRPDFNRLLLDIEKNKVNCVIVKDLSRLGREYIQSGDLLENFFPKYNVRFIALDDNIDRDPANLTNEVNLMIPFYNLLNEFYPADISKKTRSALQAKAEQGEYLSALVPYGYKRSTHRKNFLIEDKRVKGITKLIFELVSNGWSLTAAARYLGKNKIPNYNDLKNGTHNYLWTSQSISAIIKNETYLGKVVYGKQQNISYKNSQKIKIDQNKWIVKDNVHQPLVSEELFKEANKQLKSRQYSATFGKKHFLSSKLQCPDCKGPLNFCREPRINNPEEGYYVCRKNKQFGKSGCSRHYIRVSVLVNAINIQLIHFRKLFDVSSDTLYKEILTQHEYFNLKVKSELKNNIEQVLDKLEKLNRIFISLYKDKALGTINENQYAILLDDLNAEKLQLEISLKDLQEKITLINSQVSHIEDWISVFSKFETPSICDTNVLNDLIDYIEIFNKVGDTQIVRVHYNHIGLLKDIEINR